ncbi:MAG: AMP-binding protein [Proteobacteria bacterium]|nr:AMP-binding protein [Pseudomonadota bacterium]
MNLADLIDRNAGFIPHRLALRYEGNDLPYAAFASRIAAVARGLAAECGIRRGDRVAVLAANHPDYLVLLFACARLGALLVPLNWRLAVPELAYAIADAAPAALFAGAEFAPAATALAERFPQLAVHDLASGVAALADCADGEGRNPHVGWDSPLLVVYTSGTTGRPKGAVLTHAALQANAAMSQHMHAMTAADHVLTVLPFFHVGGLNIQTTPALLCGASVSIHARFAPDATIAALAAERPTLTVLVPATIQALLDHPGFAAADLSSLRAVATGSQIVPQPLVDALEARGVPVLQVYGATETSPVAVYTRLGGDRSRAGSTGLPGLLCEARVVDDAGTECPPGVAGEIEIRGPNVLVEYWGNPDATAEALHDGWYRTGDIAVRDADGHFHVRERKKNLIVSGGENIYPAEIERVLCAHPAVLDAAVIGRPDPRWQEVPVAYVIPRPETAPDAETLRAYLLSELARFKVPRDIKFVTELPRTALGKVQHHVLRASA